MSIKKSTCIKIISVLTFLCIMLGISTFIYARQADRYRFANEIAAQRAVNELCESLDNITVSLQKGLYTCTRENLQKIGNDLGRESSCAKVSLSQITDKDMISDEIYKFLSQVGDFTLSLTKKSDKLAVSEKDAKLLAELYEYSLKLSDTLTQIRDGVFDGTVAFEKENSYLSERDSAADTLKTKMTDTQQSLADYPTLIYDGPFADNVLNKEGGTLLKDQKEITREEAAAKAADLIGTSPASLKEEKDTEDAVELYCFSKGDVSVGITKKGGFVCYILNPYTALEQTISEKEAIKRAAEYLRQLGYSFMTDSYYSVYDGVCTVNFAYQNEGIIHYADLIKVSVALDTGKVTALDASAYLHNHSERDIYGEKITLEQAVSLLPEGLTLISHRNAVIPLKTGKEAYCYELHCKDKKGNEALIYIDRQSGEQQDTLLLLYFDGGVLTR